MIVLGIETSCDETALALVEVNSGHPPIILKEQIHSQCPLHAEYGGVVPELAAREHLQNLPLLYDYLKVTPEDFDAIAVTVGPGLKGCLLMGLAYAQGLSQATAKQLIAVNHIEGHILAPFLSNPDLEFPYLALVVSGGHTQVVEVQAIGEYKILAKTIDDAAGEAFDKSANLLGLNYPGGAELAALADLVDSSPYSLPKIMAGSSDFSFSGLKTSISLLIKKNPSADKAELAHAIQDAIIKHLLDKLEVAVQKTGINNIVLTGGVAANKELRKRLKQSYQALSYPELKHCTDNAAMIALTGACRELISNSSNSCKSVFPRLTL